MKDAKVSDLTTGTQAVIHRSGDVTLVRGGQAFSLRAREMRKLVNEYRVVAPLAVPTVKTERSAA